MGEGAGMNEVKFRKAPPGVTLIVTIKPTHEWRLRRWLATRLIALAAHILGCGIEFESEGKG
jgi:hypothetical protein